MSKFVSAFLGTVALVASLGAAQFAVGHDLGERAKLADAPQSSLVNRAAKADRPALVTRASGGTVLTQRDGEQQTSVAIRVPRSVLKKASSAQGKTSPRPVACEAPASVLTEVAKVMESGRCVT